MKKMSSRASRTLYVGNLPGDIREREVEDLFYKYGRIVDIDLKIPPRPPGYAFVEFEDYRDAEDAIRGRDGYNFDGNRLRVELAHGGRGSSSVDRYSSYSGGSSRGGVSRRSDYRVLVTGLPSSASWQDLKVSINSLHLITCVELGMSASLKFFVIVMVVKCTWLGFVKSHFGPALTGFMVGKGILTNFGINNGAHHKLDMSIGELNGMRGIVDYTNSDDMKYASGNLMILCSVTNFLGLIYGYVMTDVLRDPSAQTMYNYLVVKTTVMEYGSRSPSRSPYYSRSRSPSRSYSYSSRSRSKSPRAKYSHRSPYRSRSRSVSSRPHSESSLRSASRDPAFCGDLELHVRDLMGNGAQIPASHLVVEWDLDQDPDPRYHCLLVTKGSVVVQSTVPAGAQAEAAVGASLVPIHHWQDLVEVDWFMCSVSCENNEF
ncbi:unnamed protein product [Camellia sinensis]